MAETYTAMLLPVNEWTVLTCLVIAGQEAEAPVTLGWFKEQYRLLEDATEPIADILDRLRKINLAGQDFEGRWFATPRGVDTWLYRKNTILSEEQKNG